MLPCCLYLIFYIAISVFSNLLNVALPSSGFPHCFVVELACSLHPLGAQSVFMDANDDGYTKMLLAPALQPLRLNNHDFLKTEKESVIFLIIEGQNLVSAFFSVVIV